MKTPLFFTALLACLAPLNAAERAITIKQEKSRIEYHVQVPLGSFTGTLTAYECVLGADPSRGLPVSRAEVRFRIADLRSDNPQRDQAMLDWLNLEQFPECVFTLTGLEPAGPPNRFRAKGQFLFHGHARELAFPVSLSTNKEGLLAIEGETRIDTRDFGVTALRRFGVLKVDPVVNVRISLLGQVDGH